MTTSRRPLELDGERTLEAAPVRSACERIEHRLLGNRGDTVEAPQQRSCQRRRVERDREQRDESGDREPSSQCPEIVARDRAVRRRHDPYGRVVSRQRDGLGSERLAATRTTVRRPPALRRAGRPARRRPRLHGSAPAASPVTASAVLRTRSSNACPTGGETETVASRRPAVVTPTRTVGAPATRCPTQAPGSVVAPRRRAGRYTASPGRSRRCDRRPVARAAPRVAAFGLLASSSARSTGRLRAAPMPRARPIGPRTSDAHRRWCAPGRRRRRWRSTRPRGTATDRRRGSRRSAGRAAHRRARPAGPSPDHRPCFPSFPVVAVVTIVAVIVTYRQPS